MDAESPAARGGDKMPQNRVPLSVVMPALNEALSLIPLTRMAVMVAVIRMAGRSKYDPVIRKFPLSRLKSKGAVEIECGM